MKSRRKKSKFESSRTIKSLFNKLNKKEKWILALKFLENKGYLAISQEVGCSVTEVGILIWDVSRQINRINRRIKPNENLKSQANTQLKLLKSCIVSPILYG